MCNSVCHNTDAVIYMAEDKAQTCLMELNMCNTVTDESALRIKCQLKEKTLGQSFLYV